MKLPSNFIKVKCYLIKYQNMRSAKMNHNLFENVCTFTKSYSLVFQLINNYNYIFYYILSSKLYSSFLTN